MREVRQREPIQSDPRSEFSRATSPSFDALNVPRLWPIRAEKVPAVKNRCFLTISYDELTPSHRNGEAVVALARWLHPMAFGLPGDGS